MAVITEYIQFSSEGNAQVIDLTPDVSERLKKRIRGWELVE